MTAARSPKVVKLSRKNLLGKGVRVRSDTIRFLKTAIQYPGSEAIYSNPQIYRDFIGDEVESNAAFGRQIALHFADKGPRVFLETCSGPGTVIRDIRKDYPDCAFICVDFSASMVREGRRRNPHLVFVQADVTSRSMIRQVMVQANHKLGYRKNRSAKVDIAFNSASSLGFMDVKRLDSHLAVMHELLNPDGGQYFAEIGYYSSVGASWINSHYISKGHFKGRSTWDWTVTVRYFPLTDLHEITWSSWTNDNPSRLLFAASHKLRAYRASELAHMARARGLEFRLWRHRRLNEAVGYSFEEVGPDFCMQFEDDSNFQLLCEFYRGKAGQASRLDSFEFKGFTD